MIKYTFFLVRYFTFYLITFVLLKGLFLVFHQTYASKLDIEGVINIFIYGLKLDISFTGYLALVVILLLLLQTVIDRPVESVFNNYNKLLLYVIVVLHIVDVLLYSHWGFRLDLTPLNYINNPTLMVASVSAMDIVVFIVFSVGMFMTLWKLYKRMVRFPINMPFFKIPSLFFLIFLGALMILPVRGGVDVAPINVNSVYFSHIPFANQAAVNVMWNIAYDVTMKGDLDKIEIRHSEEEMKVVFDDLHGRFYTDTTILKLNGRQPNVLLVVLESFTSKLLNYRYQGQAVTPFFNQLVNGSVMFENTYATGDRTDKGLVSILSGYPAQPVTSIMLHPVKVATLPNLFSVFNEKGFETSFLYGGDLDFAGMRGYLLNSGVRHIIDKSHFPSETYGAKWGVHDHIAMDTLYNHLKQQKTPSFTTFLTISLHEPYDIPTEREFSGIDPETSFLNAARYVDKSFQYFIETLKKDPIWENLLVVFIADHGHPYPGRSSIFDPEKYHIPLFFTGGALKNSSEKVTALTSQDDLPVLLLNAFGWSAEKFIFGKNVLADPDNSFAYFSFNNGYGWLEKDFEYVYDREAKRGLTNTTQKAADYSHTYMDFLLWDFVSR